MAASTRTLARDVAITAAVALAARLAVVLLVRGRFPPADDGVLYDTLARRLASGLGYTWAWPDGAVTPVAHYPVGYPAMLALSDRLLGPAVASALVVHAVLGALGAAAIHVVAAASVPPRAARWAGLAVAFHPALLAYVPALMTEGVCAALIPLPFAAVVLARRAPTAVRACSLGAVAGALLGVAVLVRPQTLVLLPIVVWLGVAGRVASRKGVAVLVLAGAGCVVAPWTARNARELGRPVLVSANAGWNLLIGTDPEAHGSWRALEAPPGCREVWGEAEKDACFGRVARERMWAAPGAWLALVPAKLAAVFDYGGSGGSYLSRSRPDLAPRWLVLGMGGLETVFERGCVLVVLLVGSRRKRADWARWIAVASACALLTPYAWVAYVGVAVLLGLDVGREPTSALPAVTLAVLASTLVTHAVFFGAGRYGLLVYPWVAALAFARLAEAGASPSSTSGVSRGPRAASSSSATSTSEPPAASSQTATCTRRAWRGSSRRRSDPWRPRRVSSHGRRTCSRPRAVPSRARAAPSRPRAVPSRPRTV